MSHLLVVNCGSATLKYRVFAYEGGAGELQPLAAGAVERIGAPGGAASHAAAAADVLAQLRARPDVVAHRVVHGGARFAQPVVVTPAVLAELDALSVLAPLHNPPALAALRACADVLGPAVPQVAVFDTAFHAELPAVAATYALPRDLAARHQVRRYGFHGLAHRYLVGRYAVLAGIPVAAVTAVSLQLGNGCSACAVQGGRSVDTSMGFTPLEGLVMGTRSGDLDPGLVAYLAEAEGVSAATVTGWLNEQSGLRGLSGGRSDVRDLLAAAGSGEADARLALDVFAYRARKYIGAYWAVLGGPCPLLLGGGIAEHAAPVRAAICQGFEWAGIRLDPARNAALTGEGRITTDDAATPVWVLPVDEEQIIAQETLALLRR